MYVQESYRVTANPPDAGPYCTSLLSFIKVFGSQRYTDGGRRPALAALRPPRRRGDTAGPGAAPALRQVTGVLHNPTLAKTEKRAFTKGRTCVQRQAAVGRTKAVIKSSVQSWRLVEEEILAQAAALRYQHVWRDNYTSGCRSNGAKNFFFFH